MATKIGIGVSTKLDSFSAGKEAVRNALHQLARPEADVLVVFRSTIFDQKTTIKAIRSVMNYAPLVGWSSIGAITN